MSKSVFKLYFQISHEDIGRLSGISIEVIQKAISQVSVLSHLVVQVLHTLLPHLMFIRDVFLHVLAFVLNFLYDLFLIRNSGLFLFNQAFLNAFQLSTDGVQVVVMVLDTIHYFDFYLLLAFVHADVVVSPLLSENLGLLVDLSMKVISQGL